MLTLLELNRDIESCKNNIANATTLEELEHYKAYLKELRQVKRELLNKEFKQWNISII